MLDKFRLRNMLQSIGGITPTSEELPSADIGMSRTFGYPEAPQNFFPQPDVGIGDDQDYINRRLAELYNPSYEMQKQHQTMVNQFPERQDYKPSSWRKLAGVIAGAGTLDPGRAFEVSSGISEAPYDRAMYDYEKRLKPIASAAEMERRGNVEQRQLFGTVATQEARQRRIEETERKNRETAAETHRKNVAKEANDARITNIRQQIADQANYITAVDKEGFLHLIDKKTGKIQKTGIDTKELTESQKIAINFNNAVSLENIRQTGRLELEGKRQEGRMEMQFQRQEDKLAFDNASTDNKIRLAEWKRNNPNMVIRAVKGGNWVAINPADGSSVDIRDETGKPISSGTMTEEAGIIKRGEVQKDVKAAPSGAKGGATPNETQIKQGRINAITNYLQSHPDDDKYFERDKQGKYTGQMNPNVEWGRENLAKREQLTRDIARLQSNKPQQPNQQNPNAGKKHVRRKSDGVTGWVTNPDPAIYEVIP